MNSLNLDHKDVWIRAAKTAVVAFLATWAVSGNALTKDALVTALAAAGTAVWNYSLQLKKS